MTRNAAAATLALALTLASGPSTAHGAELRLVPDSRGGFRVERDVRAPGPRWSGVLRHPAEACDDLAMREGCAELPAGTRYAVKAALNSLAYVEVQDDDGHLGYLFVSLCAVLADAPAVERLGRGCP